MTSDSTLQPDPADQVLDLLGLALAADKLVSTNPRSPVTALRVLSEFGQLPQDMNAAGLNRVLLRLEEQGLIQRGTVVTPQRKRREGWLLAAEQPGAPAAQRAPVRRPLDALWVPDETACLGAPTSAPAQPDTSPRLALLESIVAALPDGMRRTASVRARLNQLGVTDSQEQADVLISGLEVLAELQGVSAAQRDRLRDRFVQAMSFEAEAASKLFGSTQGEKREASLLRAVDAGLREARRAAP